MTASPCISPVTDAMVERAWAAIVGTDVAGMCFQASIIRADLRTALEAVISPAQTATREALEEINALISNGDRPTVNERNAFEHFTVLNRLLLNIRDIARRALSSVPSTDSAPIPTENDIRHAISSALELNGLTYDGVSQAARAVLALSSKQREGK